MAIEKVNPSHPDKIADRIAGAIVDLAYRIEDNPKIAVEVLLGHGICNIITESSVYFTESEVEDVVHRLLGNYTLNLNQNAQDSHLAKNQSMGIHCGDNGIFVGKPLTAEEKVLSEFAHKLYEKFPTDGKYIYDETSGRLIVCQSNAKYEELQDFIDEFQSQSVGSNLFKKVIINPLGFWTGGAEVDAGATNRKLGSDMGRSVSGGGLWGKDISKGDFSINIYAFLKAQLTGKEVEFHCAIGDSEVDGRSYEEITSIAKEYIKNAGGFEKLSEWGLF